MTKYVVITHRDLDGIAGASLYTYCKKISEDQLKIIFIEPNNLLKFIRRYYRKGRYFAIIDIGLNKDMYNELNDIDLRDVYVEWYDHHIWDDEWVKGLQEKNIALYLDRSTCATGVVAKNVCVEQGGRVVDVVETVCSADLWKFNRYESTFLFRYADLENKNRWYTNVFKIIKSYLENSINNIVSLIEEDVSKYVDEELKVISSLHSKIVKRYVEGISVCLYFKERPIPSTSIIGNAMLSICDIAIVAHETLKSLSFRSKICNVRELAKVFNGGGHPRASGAPLNIPFIYKLLEGIGVDTARRYVIDEVLKKIEGFGGDLKSLCIEIKEYY